MKVAYFVVLCEPRATDSELCLAKQLTLEYFKITSQSLQLC